MKDQNIKNVKKTFTLLMSIIFGVALTLSSCKKEDDPEPEILTSELHGTWTYSYHYDDGDSTYTINDTLFINSDFSFNYSLNSSHTEPLGSGSSSEGTDDDDATWSFDESSLRFTASMPWPSGGELELWNTEITFVNSTNMIINQDITTGFGNERNGINASYSKVD